MGAPSPSSNGQKISGVRAGPKVVRIGYTGELGKPFRLSSLLRRVGSRKVDEGQRVKEHGRSECLPVMGKIGVQNLLLSERMPTSVCGGSW